MDFIERNELYDAEGRVYRVESYEADITTGGMEINGEFRGPVPGKKAPKMPGNRQIGHLATHFIDAAGNTVYLHGDAELHEQDGDDAHPDAAALRKSHGGSMRSGVTGQQAQAFDCFVMRTLFAKVERIITNGRSTIVCWKDGTKTRVALSAGEDTDGSVYEGFMWACAKKLFGSHRSFERLVDGVHVDQDRREEKSGKPARKPAERACRSGMKSADAKHL